LNDFIWLRNGRPANGSGHEKYVSADFRRQDISASVRGRFIPTVFPASRETKESWLQSGRVCIRPANDRHCADDDLVDRDKVAVHGHDHRLPKNQATWL
jgi:hypothetical protein